MRRALLIALPAVFLACAAVAAPKPEDAPAQAGLSAPEPGLAVTAPSPCSGCAGHDCANCPLARAETLPPCPH